MILGYIYIYIYIYIYTAWFHTGFFVREGKESIMHLVVHVYSRSGKFFKFRPCF